MKRITAYAIGLFLVSTAFSQTRVVRGDLTVFNNYGVQNVNVVSKKAKSSVITDSMGHFELVCKEKETNTSTIGGACHGSNALDISDGDPWPPTMMTGLQEYGQAGFLLSESK